MNLEAQGRRIVIADHDRTILELLQIRLSLAGYETHVERSGCAALQTIRRVRPAGLVIDCNLPELSGLGILNTLNSSRAAAPLTLIIGYKLAPSDVDNAIKLGAKDCIAKPFSGADVIERVGRMFRRHRPEQTLIPPIQRQALTPPPPAMMI